jgi:hypothetical protein
MRCSFGLQDCIGFLSLIVTLCSAFRGRNAACRRQASEGLRCESGGKAREYGRLEYTARAQQSEA